MIFFIIVVIIMLVVVNIALNEAITYFFGQEGQQAIEERLDFSHSEMGI